MAALVLAFVVGAVLWSWFNDDASVAQTQAVSPQSASAPVPAQPLLLARQEAAPAAPEQPMEKIPLPEPDTVSKPAPLYQPLAVAPDGTPSFFFCFEGNLPESRLLVVDKSRQRLMVLRYMGEMVLEYEYPCSTGSNEGGKQLEGDARTPVGIYFTTHRYVDNKISMFGDRAIHLDYPNAFDLDQSRNGQGIYIHGTNQPLKPRTSNGCVAMRNEDVALVGELIKEQVTPVIIVESLSLPELNQRIKACEWLSNINVDEMAARPARMGQSLGLLNPPAGFHYSRQPALNAIGEKLWGFTQASGKARMRTVGLSIFGLGNQWVLVANQSMKVDRQEYSIIRRLYLEGSDPRNAALLRTSWVLADQAQAKALAALAPTAPSVMLAAASPRPAPAVPGAGSPAPVSIPAPAAPPPLSPAPALAPTATDSAAVTISSEEQLRQVLKNWLNAWSGKNLNAYMAFYASDFMSDTRQDFKAWRDHKQNLFRTYATIAVKASEVKIKITNDRNAEIAFKQNYRSDWHQDVGYKTIQLRLERDGRWLIVSESWREQR